MADGRYDPDEQAANEYISVSVSGGKAPTEMAAEAGRLALSRSGIPASDVSLLLHSFAWFQGMDYWTPATYVHREVLDGNPHTPALEINQMCNSISAIELAGSYLAADPARTAVVLTTGDRYESPGFDRWRGEVAGIVYGDGGAAVVLARRGVARVLAVATVMDTGLEAMYRGDMPFSPQPGRKVDIRSRRQAFRARTPGTSDRITAGLTGAVQKTLDEAGRKLGDVARWIFPNVGLEVLQTRYLAALGLDLSVSVWDWGRRTCHIGAADQLTGLTHLLETGQVQTGDLVMLVGIGGGFGWSGALVEITEQPDWA